MGLVLIVFSVVLVLACFFLFIQWSFEVQRLLRRLVDAYEMLEKRISAIEEEISSKD